MFVVSSSIHIGRIFIAAMEEHERISSRSLADVLQIVKHGFSFSWEDFQNLVTTSKEIHDALRDTHIQVTVPNSTFALPAVLTT